MSVEGPKNPKRREFLKQTGAVAAVVTLGIGAGELLRKERNQVRINKKTKSANMNENKLEKRSDPFESNFKKREKVDIPGGSVDVVDIPAPASSDKKPMVLVPAWGMSPEVYKYVLKGFNDAGRRTMSFAFPTAGGTTELPPEDRKSFEGFPPDAIRDALTLMAVLEAQSAEDAGVVGHSKGGASAGIAALLFAQRAARGEGKRRIANLELFGSAGLIGKDNLARVGYGFAMQKSNRGQQSESFKAIPVSGEERAAAAAEGRTIAEYGAIPNTPEDAEGGAAAGAALGSHIKESGLVRTAGEVWGLSKIQMAHLLKELRSYGIGVTVMSGVDDPVFPIEKMVGTMDEKTREITPGTVHGKDVDGFLSIRAEHGIPVPYAGIIEGQLSALEAKQKRAAATSGTSGE